MSIPWQRTVGSLSLASSIFLGAYGSHGLSKLPHYTPVSTKQFETANKYQQLHSLALIVLPSIIPIQHTLCLKLTSTFFTVGTFLFSGGVYAKVLTDDKNVGKASPAGGICLALGWVVLAFLKR